MENRSGQPRSTPSKLSSSKKGKNPLPGLDKDNANNRKIEPENLSIHSLPPYLTKTSQGQNISAISLYPQSNQNSPVNFNILSELGSSQVMHKNVSAPFEESHSFVNTQFENEVVDTSNLNNKSAQILTDSKNELDHKYNLDLKSQDVRIDSSFSIRTDYSMDIGVNNENPNSRKKKNQKDSSKVTFDDSLNTDLLYDRSISSIHPTKGETKKEKSKKQQEFISVYSGRPIENEQENNNKNTEKVEEPKQEQIQRKGSLNLEYKPEKPEQVEDQIVNDLFFGVTERQSHDGESRWSKLTEDEAARLFEQRKNNIFKGLKKLNKTRSVTLGKPNQTSSPKVKRFADNKSEIIRPASVNTSESHANQQKIVDMMIMNPERKRSSSNLSSKRKSPTPQKSSRGITITEPSTRKNEQTKTLNINLKLRSRSLSHDEIKPVEVLSRATPVKNPSSNEKKMIDEIYQLAKEDVQKRIASIEKRLIENGHYDMSKNTPRDNSVKSGRSQSPNVQLISNTVEKEKRVTNQRNEERLYQRSTSPKVFEILKPDQQMKKQENVKKRKEESPIKEVKIIPNKMTPIKSNYGSPQNYSSNKNLGFNIGPSEKEKVVMRPSSGKIERDSSARREKIGNESVIKRSQQVVQDPETPKSYSSKRSENKQLNVKIISPKRTPNTPTKFPNADTTVVQKMNSSQISNEKEKKAYTSPRTQDNQTLLDDSVANFLRLEKALKAQIAKEAQETRKIPLTGSPIRAKNERIMTRESENPRATPKKEEPKLRESVMNQEKKNAGTEVKYFTLRHQSTDKISQRKNSPNNFPLKTVERVNRITAEKPINQRMSLREPKPVAQVNEPSNMNQPQGIKILRSQSNQKMKATGFERSPKNVPKRMNIPEKPNLYENPSDVSSISIKSVSHLPTRPLPSQNRSEILTKTVRSPVSKAWLSPTIKQSAAKTHNSESDDIVFPKSVTFKNNIKPQEATVIKPRGTAPVKSQETVLIRPQEKKPVEKKNPPQVTKKEPPKETYISVTSSEDLEELLRQNYQLLEIRNNQYVFINRS